MNRTQLRIECPHCKQQFWFTPGGSLSAMAILSDHDRYDGKRCRKGRQS